MYERISIFTRTRAHTKIANHILSNLFVIHSITKMEIIKLPFGVILLKNFFDDDEQKGIVEELLHLHTLNDSRVVDTSINPNPMFAYDIDPKYAGIHLEIKDKLSSPADHTAIERMLRVGKDIATVANHAKENDEYERSMYKFHIPIERPVEGTEGAESAEGAKDAGIEKRHVNADTIYCVSYDSDGKCFRHADYWNSWVFGASFGHASDFRYGIRPDQTEKHKRVKPKRAHKLKKAYKDRDIVVRVESGDVLIFNGNVLFHSVIKIYEDLPEFWEQLEGRHPKVNRICLQFRDKRTADNEDTNMQDRHLLVEHMARSRAAMTKAGQEASIKDEVD